MKIVENRKTPEPPPVESYTLTVTPAQLRMLRYFATTADEAHGAVAALSFLEATKDTEAAKLPVDWNVRFE